MIVEAICFDLDGVLVDACDWHYKAFNKALDKVAGITISHDDHIKTFNGLTTNNKLKILGIEEDKKKEIWEWKQEYTKSLITSEAKILDEKIELFDFLKSENIKLCCVTNSVRQSAELMLSLTGQIDYMDFIVSNEDVANNKPHPDPYNLAVHIFKTNPLNMIAVEDSPKGKQSAGESKIKHLWEVNNATEVNIEEYRRYINENINSYGG